VEENSNKHLDDLNQLIYTNNNSLHSNNKINSHVSTILNQFEKVDLNSFKILEMIGKGSFGEVYLVENIKTTQKYAMKVLNKNKILSQNIVRYVITERNVLSNIKHPYIVRLYYAFQTDDFLYLILEYCEGRDLNHYLRKSKYFSEEFTKIILAQVILALEELHKNSIIYRYIKFIKMRNYLLFYL